MRLIPRMHYLAVIRSPVDGKLFISNMLYPSEEEAKKDNGMSFHKLWKEGPSILLDAPEPPPVVVNRTKMKEQPVFPFAKKPNEPTDR